MTLEYFCTQPGDEGTYAIAVASGDYGGFGDEDDNEIATTNAGLRDGRGRFELSVRLKSFERGSISLVEGGDSSAAVREGQWGGCIAYGQNVSYTVTSYGAQNGALYARVDGAVSRLRARCDGCDEWSEATLADGAASVALSRTQCDVRLATNWTIEVSMDEFAFIQRSLLPTEFQLTVRLFSAAAVGKNAALDVVPASEGGAGFICCGHIRSWGLLDLPQTHAPMLTLNVTRGKLRAVFLRQEMCASPADANGPDACAGECYTAWYTLYDTFYGTTESTYTHSLAVPFGPEPWIYDELKTGRRAGDWYISVLGLEEQEAEFYLEARVLAPDPAPASSSCSRFELCPQQYHHEGRPHAGAVSFSTYYSSGAAPHRGDAARGIIAVLAIAASGFLGLLSLPPPLLQGLLRPKTSGVERVS